MKCWWNTECGKGWSNSITQYGGLGGGGDSIILQNCFPQEVRPTCIIWGKVEKKVGKGLLITVKYTEILSRRWNQDSYCFLDLKV